MERRSTLRSDIGVAPQQHGDARDVSETAAATGKGRPIPLQGSRGRAVSEARVFSQLRTRDVAESTSAITFDYTECSDMPPLSPSKESIFKDFCRGQPPRRSFLDSDGHTPPRLRMSRRSTLADRPELDAQLNAVMVRLNDEMFLPLNTSTVSRIMEYLNGSKPLVHVYCVFGRLLINTKSNEVRPGLLIAALEKIGPYCGHLAVGAPFHTTEFVHTNCKVDKPEPRSDWDKILECFPNLRKISFAGRTHQPVAATRETFKSLKRSLLNNTIFQKYTEVDNGDSIDFFFDYLNDFHSIPRDNQRYVSAPLNMVGSDMVFADGAEDDGLLDIDSVFGQADDIGTIDG